MPVGVLGQSDMPWEVFKMPVLKNQSPMPVGVLGQSDLARGLSYGEACDVTNACRRFGSVGPGEAAGGKAAGEGSPMPVGVLGQSDLNRSNRGSGPGNCHQCLSAFWVSRTRY